MYTTKDRPKAVWLGSSVSVMLGRSSLAALAPGQRSRRWLPGSGKPRRESLKIMSGIILRLLLAVSTVLLFPKEPGNASEKTAEDQIACYNVITGQTFSASECDLRACRSKDGSGRQFSGTQSRHGDGYGPCIRQRKQDERDSEIECSFGPGFLLSRGKPVQAFSSPICAEAKVEFRQCINGTMLGTYQYPNCK
jgi:hypothetical protein